LRQVDLGDQHVARGDGGRYLNDGGRRRFTAHRPGDPGGTAAGDQSHNKNDEAEHRDEPSGGSRANSEDDRHPTRLGKND
jgi:hypothetical protein